MKKNKKIRLNKSVISSLQKTTGGAQAFSVVICYTDVCPSTFCQTQFCPQPGTNICYTDGYGCYYSEGCC